MNHMPLPSPLAHKPRIIIPDTLIVGFAKLRGESKGFLIDFLNLVKDWRSFRSFLLATK